MAAGNDDHASGIEAVDSGPSGLPAVFRVATTSKTVAIIGGGPSGLMAAEVLSAAGVAVTIYEAMPTAGRKFLLAGKSGLNLTHGELHERLAQRYGAASGHLRAALDAFTAQDIRAWAQGLGIETFAGSSGRVFPHSMKASPLLRAWLSRLAAQGVRLETRHRMTGISEGALTIEGPDGPIGLKPDATLLALGGASWPRLGSDAAWVPLLASRGVDIAPLRPANCGFDAAWSETFRQRFAGAPVKSVTLTSDAGTTQGEFVVSIHGVEGGLIYTHAAALRDRFDRQGRTELLLDLMPGRDGRRLADGLARQKAKDSFATRLRKGAGLEGVKAALLRECAPDAARLSPEALAARIKALPVPLGPPRPLAEAISTAGGITMDSIDSRYMLKSLPGVFAAGEMLDWEAPTGGYLLTACLATGRAAALGVLDWITT